ncbi:MAG TPA: HNH endonuclease [Pyrinomonadaceae bacterium]|jgi:hypothetical protein
MDPEVIKKKKRKDSSSESSSSESAKSPKKRAKKTVEGAKAKASGKAKIPCPKAQEQEWAEEYAEVVKKSGGVFRWDELPDVPAKKRAAVRRLARESGLTPQVDFVFVTGRNLKRCKCPIFPQDRILVEEMLPENLHNVGDDEQFEYLTKKTQETHPEFTYEKGLNGKRYTWHHHHDTGKMQLVESGIHSVTKHDGGREIWALEPR